MMKKLVLVSMIALACASCSLFGSGQPNWDYEKSAIELNLKSDPHLNLYQGKAHTLMVCVYHLRDLNGFNQLVDEKNGLARLLECGRIDPGVTYAKRLVIQPGLESKEIMDRTEGAKYVGIVAGYYDLQKESAVRAFQIPLSFFDNPEKLHINLELGATCIRDIEEQ